MTFPLFERSASDYKLITKSFSKVWGEVPGVLSKIDLDSKIGSLILNIDWEEHIPVILEKNAINSFFTIENYFSGKFTEEQLWEFGQNNNFPDCIDVNCLVKVDTTKNANYSIEKIVRVIEYYIENIFFQIFLTLNLSAPGSFDSYNPTNAKTNLELHKYSSSQLETAWINSINLGWPEIESLELSKVWAWMESLEFGSRQIAKNRTEKALFSILHFCCEEKVSPTQLIWISLALEALYDTPKGQINRIFLDRIILFLNIPENNKKVYKKKIRDFYDLRSRFVHGDLDIENPLKNNVLDNSIFDYDSIILENCAFGLSIVIATLQKMIKNQWNSLDFYESYKGVK
ncbi:HEPN domain-containing protein [Salibacterium aidingense]|uniref:HEPN domain-containing protein n=1 Tax=Salibacterium aidingense TaxID=384933 RepID=UPI00040BC105|nr:HEPN domain-containing protein [Salibacterium aidingense]